MALGSLKEVAQEISFLVLVAKNSGEQLNKMLVLHQTIHFDWGDIIDYINVHCCRVLNYFSTTFFLNHSLY